MNGYDIELIADQIEDLNAMREEIEENWEELDGLDPFWKLANALKPVEHNPADPF